MHRSALSCCVALLASPSLALPCAAQFTAEYALDPKRYTSPSGEYALLVDPSQPREGDERWKSSGFRPKRAVAHWQPFFARGGSELWLVDGARAIERYELP